MKPEKSILDYLEFSSPTDEQKLALLAMEDLISQKDVLDFLILSGAAGTGKTSITTCLIKYLKSKDIHFKIAAPTGRAARILGKKAKTESTTIHSLIYNSVSDPNTGEVIFKLKPNPVKDKSVYIIDEASMIASIVIKDEASLFVSTDSLLNDLVKFIKDGNKKNKLILLGDRNQLPPIQENDSKALSQDYLENNYNLKGSSYRLTEVKRQKKDSYILKNAVAIREAIDDNMPAENLVDVDEQRMNIAALNYIKEYREFGFDQSISIGATHKMNQLFNRIVREYMFGYGAEELVEDDLLLIISTWRRKSNELYSGDHVVIKNIDLDKIERVAGLRFAPVQLTFKNLRDQEETVSDYLLLDCLEQSKGLNAEQERSLRSERFRANKIYQKSSNPTDDKYVGAIRATYGYSITCHKAQGGEWEKVYLNSYFMPSLRFQYTAITRAKQELIIY
jgi:exodeoxyribonuclease V